MNKIKEPNVRTHRCAATAASSASDPQSVPQQPFPAQQFSQSPPSHSLSNQCSRKPTQGRAHTVLPNLAARWSVCWVKGGSLPTPGEFVVHYELGNPGMLPSAEVRLCILYR